MCPLAGLDRGSQPSRDNHPPLRGYYKVGVRQTTSRRNRLRYRCACYADPRLASYLPWPAALWLPSATLWLASSNPLRIFSPSASARSKTPSVYMLLHMSFSLYAGGLRPPDPPFSDVVIGRHANVGYQILDVIHSTEAATSV